MDETNEERQENELLALKSIYTEKQFVSSTEKNGGTFFVQLQLPSKFKVAYPKVKDLDISENPVPSDEEPPWEELVVQYLPQIVLDFELPAGYPSDDPPLFSLSCKWLNRCKLTILCEQLDNIWSEVGPGMEVLFDWIQFITDDTLSFLKITSPMYLKNNFLQQNSIEKPTADHLDKRAVQDIASLEILVNFIANYDSIESVEQFNSNYISCGICFSEKLGSQCVKFPQCDHAYCTECVTGYFLVQINDGSVRALNCPEDKCDSQANPDMVKKLVPEKEYERYEKVLLQTTLDCMEDMTYCPRKTCQSVVIMEPDSKNMGRCPVCSFVFCVFCKRTYHGITNCEIKNKDLLNLRDEYINGSPEVKAKLEKKYGVARLQYICNEYYTEAWIKENAMNCPQCNTSIEKIDGCNKMTCSKCRCYFCWLCGKKINSSNPYAHFNELTSPCFNKLFLGELDEARDIFDDDGFMWD